MTYIINFPFHPDRFNPDSVEHRRMLIEAFKAALMPEPLAKLAARKGWWLARAREFPDRWVLNFDSLSFSPVPIQLEKPIVAHTYEQAESLAREYLEKLEDVK